MKSFLKQFKKQAQGAALSPSELETGRHAVRVFMAQNPLPQHAVRKAGLGRQLWQTREWLPSLSFLKEHAMSFIAILLTLMLTGGGVSLAAEQSLPGDTLYPIKVSVNEEVREAFAVTAEAKAQWEIRRAERRLEEAEQLSVEGKLDETSRDRIEANFEAQATRIRERIKKFEEEKDLHAAANISANFESSLDAHEQVLTKLAEKHDGHTTAIKEKIAKRQIEAQDDREDIEKKVEAEKDENDEQRAESKSAAEGKMNAAQHKIDEVKAFVEKAAADKKISAETKTQADAKLVAVAKIMTDGQAALTAGDYAKAFVAFQNAHRQAQEVKLLVAAEKTLSVRVEINADDHGKSRDEGKDDDKDENRDRDEARDSKEDSEDDDKEDEIKAKVNVTVPGIKLDLSERDEDEGERD